MKKCHIDGVWYKSETLAAMALGIEIRVLQTRLQSPDFPEYLSEYHPKEEIKGTYQQRHSCTIDGVDYKSENAACRALGIGRTELRQRLQSLDFPGYVSEHRLKKKFKEERYSCTIDGVDYKSEHEANKILGVGIRELRNRLQSPDFPEYVSKYRKKEYRNKKRRGFPCSVAGIEYKSIGEATRELGISHNMMIKRLSSFDYPDYVSEKYPKKPSVSYEYKHPCIVAGVEYESVLSAAKELRISNNEIRRRLASFDYPGYVCNKIPKKISKRKKRPCTINGVHYETEKIAAKDLGIDIRTLRKRLMSSNFCEYTSEYHTKVESKPFTPCSVAGVEYMSIRDAAKELGIYSHELKRRLYSDDYPDYICAKYPKKPFKYEVKGKRYKSLQEIANVEGLTRERIRQKLNDTRKPEYRKL